MVIGLRHSIATLICLLIGCPFWNCQTFTDALANLALGTNAGCRWPNGFYKLPSPNSGCPCKEGFLEQKQPLYIRGAQVKPGSLDRGYSYVHLKKGNGYISNCQMPNIRRKFHISKVNPSGENVEGWMPGQYCVFGVKDQPCPHGLTPGKMTFSHTKKNSSHMFLYCCSTSGSKYDWISMPSSNPFYLLPLGDQNCQKVKKMRVEREYLKWRMTSGKFLVKRSKTTAYFNLGRNNMTLHGRMFMYNKTFHWTVKRAWPSGPFRLPSSRTGCPSKDIFTSKDVVMNIQSATITEISTKLQLDANNSKLTVCDRTIGVTMEGPQHPVTWPDGKYCVFGEELKPCAPGLKKGQTEIRQGTSDNITLFYCCATVGMKEIPIYLPTSKPFFLIPNEDQDCQKVDGMECSAEHIVWTLSKPHQLDVSSDNHGRVGYHHILFNDKEIRSYYCYYTPEVKEHVSSHPIMIFRIVIGIILPLVLCASMKMIYRVVKECRRTRNSRKGKSVNNKLVTAEVSSTDKSTGQDKELGYILKVILDPDVQLTIRKLLICPQKIQTMDKIGKGAFGTVYMGRYRPDDNPHHTQNVAIKTLRDNCVYSEISGFMEEAVVMADFNHFNVLGILGICVKPETGIPTIILPYMEHGDLQTFLRSFRYDDNDIAKEPPGIPQLLSFSLGVARGMDYLAGLKFAHRDLAARNCMVDGQMVVKVADFGLARDVYSSSYYRQDKHRLLPIKWMAIESLQDRVFTLYTDIWAYGVTLWEIFSLGRTPYSILNNSEVLAHLEEGTRLGRPDLCPEELYQIMQECWQNNPRERPSFGAMVTRIEAIMTTLCGYLDLDLMVPNVYENSELLVGDLDKVGNLDLESGIPGTDGHSELLAGDIDGVDKVSEIGEKVELLQSNLNKRIIVT